MSFKIDSIRYILASAILLCSVVTARAQSELTSSKVIVSSRYSEVDDKLKFVDTVGTVRVMSKEDLDARVVVDKSNNQITITMTGQTPVVQSMEQDVVVINIDGVTVLTKSAVERVSKIEMVYAASETPTKDETPADAECEKRKVKSGSRVVEMAASIKGGGLFYDELVTLVSASLRSTIRLKSILRVGLSLSTDVYTAYSEADLNSREYSMYMLSTAFACDLSLWDRDRPSILPARLMIDVGTGFGLNTTEAQGLTFSPGLMWYLAGKQGNAKLCMTLNYKYQSFSSESYASGMMLGLGYKF